MVLHNISFDILFVEIGDDLRGDEGGKMRQVVNYENQEKIINVDCFITRSELSVPNNSVHYDEKASGLPRLSVLFFLSYSLSAIKTKSMSTANIILPNITSVVNHQSPITFDTSLTKLLHVCMYLFLTGIFGTISET